MPREARTVVEGGFYHIVTRGNDRRRLFHYKQDYESILELVRKYLAKYDVGFIHYCLMPNHLHLLIRACKAADLPKFMQGVLQVYAEYFRKRYKSAGYVFQNRYKSFLIENEAYLLECGRYIERNPLRAGITKDPLSYPWSSFAFYGAGRANDIINLIDPLYAELGKTDTERQQQYQKYVFQQRPYDLIVDEAFRI